MFSPFLHVFVLTLESDYIGFIIILVCLCLWPYHMTLLVNCHQFICSEIYGGLLYFDSSLSNL